ncbi:hypothetical protein NU10_13035 [Flavobacterium dauae]|uniref:hypothetical protein n=1 Tax=Flavobacterium dauae TaxID=1563479 RepID=UPI00101CC88E|nr:hypothetical protein [Flavobacterium dauae]WLD23614.1 hypothetical protein NU10_13035 [Flavobacterium dauae]
MLKFIKIIPLILITSMSFGQSYDNIGQNDSNLLNKEEADLLNCLLIDSRGEFNFHEKKIVFITGSSGNTIVSKSLYFKKSILPWVETNKTPQVFMLKLTPGEKEKTGGIDAFVLSWVKFYNDKQKTKTIRKIVNQNH